ALSGYSVSSFSTSPLSYLASVQFPDGSWGPQDPYLTARALEAFAAKLPNLVVVPGTFVLTPSPVTDGGTVTAKLTVKNAGAATAVGTTVALTTGQDGSRTLPVTPTLSVGSLSPGAQVNLTGTFAATQMVGLQTVVATVDPTNQIVELRKDDNVASATVTV